MGFFDKFKFWKHEGVESFPPIGGGPPTLEPLFPTGMEGQFGQQADRDFFGGSTSGTFGSSLGSAGVPPAPKTDFGSSGPSGQQFGGSQYPAPTREPMVSPIIQPQQYQPVTQSPKEFEAVNSKLDTIKSMLETINLRLEKIERPLLESQKPLEKEIVRRQSEWRY